jgi:hypothetical protein
MTTWNQKEAISFCAELEEIAPIYGAHVALTGGCLYKEGERKDVDILLYRIRQFNQIDIEGLFAHLQDSCYIEKPEGFGWVYKSSLKGKGIDFFFPEEAGGIYERADKSDMPLSPFDLGL